MWTLQQDCRFEVPNASDLNLGLFGAGARGWFGPQAGSTPQGAQHLLPLRNAVGIRTCSAPFKDQANANKNPGKGYQRADPGHISGSALRPEGKVVISYFVIDRNNHGTPTRYRWIEQEIQQSHKYNISFQLDANFTSDAVSLSYSRETSIVRRWASPRHYVSTKSPRWAAIEPRNTQTSTDLGHPEAVEARNILGHIVAPVRVWRVILVIPLLRTW